MFCGDLNKIRDLVLYFVFCICIVCINCTDNDMSMKRCSNYSVLRRTNQDQGFGYAVLQTLNSSDSENLRSLVPKLLNENMFLCIRIFPCPILRLPHSQS